MSHTLAYPTYNEQSDRLAFFQEMILSGLSYWKEHPAIQELDGTVLDRERDSILSALNRGLEFDQAWPQTLKLIDKLAAYMERRGYWTAWRTVLEKALVTSQRVGDIQGETTMSALLARLSQRQNRGEDVVRYYRQAMKLATQNDDQYEYARACCNLGYYYIDAGHWWRSEVLSLRALEIFEKLGNDHGLAHTHNHLGLLYLRDERWDDSRTNLTAACDIWQTMKDTHNLLYGYLNLGLLEIELENSQRALNVLVEAYEISSGIGEKLGQGKILHNIAIAYFQEMEWEEAEKSAKEAEKNFRKFAYEQGLADVWQTLGLIYIHIAQDNLAIDYFKESLAMNKKLRNKHRELRVRNAIREAAALSSDDNAATRLRNLAMSD